jgi:hypothetical protein
MAKRETNILEVEESTNTQTINYLAATSKDSETETAYSKPDPTEVQGWVVRTVFWI